MAIRPQPSPRLDAFPVAKGEQPVHAPHPRGQQGRHSARWFSLSPYPSANAARSLPAALREVSVADPGGTELFRSFGEPRRAPSGCTPRAPPLSSCRTSSSVNVLGSTSARPLRDSASKDRARSGSPALSLPFVGSRSAPRATRATAAAGPQQQPAPPRHAPLPPGAGAAGAHTTPRPRLSRPRARRQGQRRARLPWADGSAAARQRTRRPPQHRRDMPVPTR